jgi:hypothetical protein
MFADHPQQRRVAIGVNTRRLAVDGKGDRRHETSPSIGARAGMAWFYCPSLVAGLGCLKSAFRTFNYSAIFSMPDQKL